MSAPVHVIGAGPAGLMAAERLAGRGLKVVVHDRMPSVARKFLMAGRGGLNLTHSEGLEDTAAFLANLRGVSIEDLAETTTDNFFGLFWKAA